MTKKKFKYFFSIIIPVLNNELVLKNFKSILKQRFKNYEIIIIDGGSKMEQIK